MNYYDKYIKYKNKYYNLKYGAGNSIKRYIPPHIRRGDTSSKKPLIEFKSVSLNSNSNIKLLTVRNTIDRKSIKLPILQSEEQEFKNRIIEKNFIIYQTQRMKLLTEKQINKLQSKNVDISKVLKKKNYYLSTFDNYKKYISSKNEYNTLMKNIKTPYNMVNKSYDNAGPSDIHKMYSDYKYLYKNVTGDISINNNNYNFTNLLDKLYTFIENNNNNITCCFVTPTDIINNESKHFRLFDNSDFMLNQANTIKRLITVSNESNGDNNNLVSNYDNLMYMFKNALKDNSRYCNSDFNTAVDTNIVGRLYGFNKVDVFYHFMIFFQELHRIKELSEDSKKNSSIIRIKIKKENRQKLIENIDNIRNYFFKEYGKDFKDNTELLDDIYVVDYIIYKMDLVYNDIVNKLKRGEVYRYIISIIEEFKNQKPTILFEKYLDDIKSSNIIIKSDKEKKQEGTYRRDKNTELKENNFTDFATLFVNNVCPMELKISINMIPEYYFNQGCDIYADTKNMQDYDKIAEKNKNFNSIIQINKKNKIIAINKKNFLNFYNENNTKVGSDTLFNIINQVKSLKLTSRPVFIGKDKYINLLMYCGEKFIVHPWNDNHGFNSKLQWHIDINKWMISCLLKRKQDIKCIIVHKNPDEKDTYKNKKVYMRISMFNERKELNLEMKNFIGCMIHKLKDRTTNKFYISYLFNNNDENIINYYNFRASLLYPKDVLTEAYNLTYIELNTLLYYNEDIGEELHFYLYDNINSMNSIILISTKKNHELSKKYHKIIELQLIKTDTLKYFIFIKK